MSKILVASLLVAACGAACAAPETYAIDPNHAIVVFEVSHFGTSTNRGRMQAKEGTVTLDRAGRTGKVDVTVDMATISTTVPSFEGVLKGERMFNVAQNPTARFVGESVAFDGDKIASVTGTLTLMGKAQPATLKATRFNCYENGQHKRQVCGGDFETTIQRSQFGLGNFAAVAPDDVRVLIQIEADPPVAGASTRVGLGTFGPDGPDGRSAVFGGDRLVLQAREQRAGLEQRGGRCASSGRRVDGSRARRS